jgi:hypothetical protein
MYNYLLIIILVALLLNTPSMVKYNLSTQKQLLIVLIILLAAYLLNTSIYGGYEGYEGYEGFDEGEQILVRKAWDGVLDIDKVAQELELCDNPLPTINNYTQTYRDEDYGNTGLAFDNDQQTYPLLQHGQFEEQLPSFNEVYNELNEQRYNYEVNSPGYYLLNNNKYSNDGLPYEKVADIIHNSKLNDIYNQHNYNLSWSPDIYLGKDRVPLSWDLAN